MAGAEGRGRDEGWLRPAVSGVGAVLLGLALAQVWWGWPGVRAVTVLALLYFVLAGLGIAQDFRRGRRRG